MEVVTVSPKYQVVIPKSIRENLGVRPGDKVAMMLLDGVIHVVRIRDIKEFRGRFPGLTTEGLREKEDRF